MKQFYALSLALLAASATALSVEATTNINFVCPNHSEVATVVSQYYDMEVYQYVDDVTYTFDDEGKLTVPFDYDAYEYQRILVNVDSDSEYVIRSITSDSSSVYISKKDGDRSYKIDPYLTEDVDDITVTVNLAAEDELFGDKFYLTVDDPTLAKLSLYNSSAWTFRSVDVSEFVAGEETAIEFNAEAENTLYIRSNDSDNDVYKVVKNGETTTLDSNGIEVAADDHIEVYYTWPTMPVTITYRTDESKGCITDVTVNNKSIENFDEGFEVKVGSSIDINGDEDAYSYKYLAVNGEEYAEISFPMTIQVQEETNIVVEAHPYAVYSYTVNVDDPNNIIFNAGSDTEVTLAEGANELTISEKSPYVTVSPKNDMCLIKSIVDGDGNSLYSPSTSDKRAAITVTDDMVINITTDVIVRDKEFVLYFDDPDALEYGQYLYRGDGTSLEKSGSYNEGYTKYAFGDVDNDFTFYFYGVGDDDPNNVYINDVKQESVNGEGSVATYKLTLADKDVVKLFFGSNPELYNVSFDIAEGVELAVVKDLITEASVEGFQALTGTQVDVKVSAEDGYDLYVNGEKVAVEEDACSFNVAADTVVKVTLASENGISAVSAESLRGNVYNLQGISVGTDLNSLPAGLYILNGRKVRR
jgi:hypothetical protein